MTTYTKKDLDLMDPSKRTDTFLSQFKAFEAFLSRIVGSEKYTSYSQCLNTIYSKRLISSLNGDDYDFLKSAGELRNIISHHDQICDPSSCFLYKFIRLTDFFMYPVSCKDIATPYSKMMVRNPSATMGDLLMEMKKKSFTHVPIVESDRLIGVFSMSSFYENATKGEFAYKPTMKVSEFVIDLDSHSSEKFLFVDSKMSAIHLIDMFKKTVEHEKRTAVVFVTTDGTKNGRLLGMITQTDLIKLK